MDSKYIRKHELLIGDGSSAIDLSQMQCRFSVKMGDVSHPQYATFRIYNLSEQTRASIKAQAYNRVAFQAGYRDGHYGTIFDGEVIQGVTGRESPTDTFIDILAAVGVSAHEAGMNQTFAAGSTSKDVAKAAADAMGLPLNDHSSSDGIALPRGRVVYGQARDALSDATRIDNSTWFYDHNGLNIVDYDKFRPGAPIEINSGTGMIGWPEQTQEGIQVRCLLNPLISVATRFRLNNASIQQIHASADIKYLNLAPRLDADGLYRVLYFEHVGDTRGQAWYTDIIGVSVNETDDGGISAMAARGLL